MASLDIQLWSHLPADKNAASAATATVSAPTPTGVDGRNWRHGNSPTPTAPRTTVEAPAIGKAAVGTTNRERKTGSASAVMVAVVAMAMFSMVAITVMPMVAMLGHGVLPGKQSHGANSEKNCKSFHL